MFWVVVVSVILFVFFAIQPIYIYYIYKTATVDKAVKCRCLGWDTVRNRRTGVEAGVAKILYWGKTYTFSFDMDDLYLVDKQIVTVDVIHFHCPKILTPGMELEELWFKFDDETLKRKIRKVLFSSVVLFLILEAVVIGICVDMTRGV